jgi:polysaccharide pyruvyl transferase WcaK-like protein
MKVVVCNDTRQYHYGCEQVMKYLNHELAVSEHEIVDNFFQVDPKVVRESHSFKQCNAIVVNGEGTMHHRQQNAVDLLEIMSIALRCKKKVALVNSVFQDMSLTKIEVETLKNSYVSVREVKSQKYLAKYGIQADVHLDFSYWQKPHLEQKIVNKDLVCGEMFFRGLYRYKKDLNRVSIFNQGWSEMVNDIRSAEWFITGRHHEMYAACIAETPFVVLQGNTWKNDGLLETAGVNIPTVHGASLDGMVDQCWEACKKAHANGQYQKLFDFMSHQSRFTFKNLF